MKYIPVYDNWLHFIRYMQTGAEVADFFEAIFGYLRHGTEPEGLTPLGMMSFGVVRPFLDESKERWNRRAEASRRNGMKGAKMKMMQTLEADEIAQEDAIRAARCQ